MHSFRVRSVLGSVLSQGNRDVGSDYKREKRNTQSSTQHYDVSVGALELQSGLPLYALSVS
jgi:hypothetical protein